MPWPCEPTVCIHKKCSQNSVHKARGQLLMRARPVAMVFPLRSVLPVVAHNVGPANGSSPSGTEALLSSSSELMLPQHNARQGTVTKPRVGTSCCTERRFETSLCSWHVNHADPITGAKSTGRRRSGNTGKPLTRQFMNSKN